MPVVYILAFAPQLLESSLTLLHRHRVIEVPRGILPLFVRNGRTSKRVIVIGINAPILRHLLSSFLFSLAVSFFFFFLFKLVYHSVDSCKAFSFGAFRKILQRILQVYRFGVRRQFVENLCTLRQLFVVFAVFVQQTKGFVIATAGIAELFLCPIQVAKTQKQYSFLYSATCRFLVALLIGRNGVCCIFVGKIDIAHCIVDLVEILLVLVGSNHTFQAAYHLFGLSCCHYFGCCNACIKLQLVGWIGTNDVMKSVVSCVFVAKSSLNLSHKIPLACFLLASHFLFNDPAQVGNGFFEFARVYVIVGKGVIPFANSTPIY